jgi:pimeloyl-ACP methyl ester carboxylesterase
VTKRSRWIDLDGPVHYLDFGGPSRGPLVVCVHGLGGSALNWSAIAPLLTGRCRLLAPDLAGHGLTQSLGRGSDVAANRMLLHRFTESVASGPVILMGNSMGGMISLLEASAAPDGVAGLILLDPALPFVPVRLDPWVAAMFALYATPGLGRLVMHHRRMSPEDQVAAVLSVCCADPSRVAPGLVAEHVEQVRQRAAFDGARDDFLSALRSVVATAGGPWGHAYRRGVRSVGCPVLLVHGERDRLVPASAARGAVRANPGWWMAELPGVGHVPQLEAPRETADAILEWLGSAGRQAAKLAATRWALVLAGLTHDRWWPAGRGGRRALRGRS